MMWFSILPFLLLASMTHVISGYYIDPESCGDLEQVIEAALDGSFRMARAGRDALRVDRQSRPEQIQNLIGYLFAREGDDPKTLVLGRAANFFANVLSLMSDKTTTPQQNDVAIYCDDSRFEKKNLLKPWRFTDKVTGVELSYTEGSCKGIGQKFDLTLAVTWNPQRKFKDASGRTQTEELTTQISLCPWFVQWLRASRVGNWDDVMKRTRLGQKIIEKATDNKGLFTQIDAFDLLEKVLLHEMLHGRGVEYRGLRDVPGKTITSNLPIIGYPSYGWKRCRELAKKGEAVDQEWTKAKLPDAPDANCDTLALFGSVAAKIGDADNPRSVDGEGRIISLRSTS